MKIVIINKSDSTGGAAVVSRRLMEALRAEGQDAMMLVTEKLTDSPFVEKAGPEWAVKGHFLSERLGIFLANGLNRSTLFKIDTASSGLPLWRHPLVADADAILLNWVNQGMLSLYGVRKILELGKPVVWTMHDMWCMTGVCHHAGKCGKFKNRCGGCPLLGSMAFPDDISRLTWRRKLKTGLLPQKIKYVAVSNWLAAKARESSLLSKQEVAVIPNAFPLPTEAFPRRRDNDDPVTVLFGAARIDDTVKNHGALVAMTKALARDWPALAAKTHLVTFGGMKNPRALDGVAVAHTHLGVLQGEEAVRRAYENADILVSSSSYETLPGTLVEAQAYGCIPVSFDQGGQADIVSHMQTGYIARYTADAEEAGRRLAEGVAWAAARLDGGEAYAQMLRDMRESVRAKFSPEAVARAYMEIIRPGIAPA